VPSGTSVTPVVGFVRPTQEGSPIRGFRVGIGRRRAAGARPASPKGRSRR